MVKSLNRSITEPQISFYSDRIEILSHGGLPYSLTKESYDNIIKRLKDNNVEILYFFLDGDYKTIHDRILKRGEDEDSWCTQNVKMCLDDQNNDSTAIHIDTVDKTSEEIVKEIITKKSSRLWMILFLSGVFDAIRTHDTLLGVKTLCLIIFYIIQYLAYFRLISSISFNIFLRNLV